MTPNADIIATIDGLEYGLQTYPNGEADVIVTTLGGRKAVEVESFPHRAAALKYIHERSNLTPLIPTTTQTS